MSTFSNYYRQDIKTFLKNKKTSRYTILNHTLSKANDIQMFVRRNYSKITSETKIVVISFNFLWKPILNLATKVGLRKEDLKEPNWLTQDDIQNMFFLEGFEEIKRGKRFIMPLNLGFISNFINKYIAQLPLINNLCLTDYQIFKGTASKRDYSVSIIIPARNEYGNVKGILKKIPKLGSKTEVIFVEGGSKDNTYDKIVEEISKNNLKWLDCRIVKQKGKGKKDAVELGFSLAKNDILMILDADLTVAPTELSKFYAAISEDKGELIIGSRLVYPMEKQSMRLLNYFGNKIFSLIFSFIIGQKIKDTLCGTKVISRKNYMMIKKRQKYLGGFDPFGDFDLIFGATMHDLKILEIPIRYRERTYGSTNISRFKHGLLLLKMALVGARRIKFI